MTSEEIQFGHYYWVRVADLPQRRVLVDWSCPADQPAWFCCWDVDNGAIMVLGAADFIRCCDNEVTWAELLRLGPEHRERTHVSEDVESEPAQSQASMFHA